MPQRNFVTIPVPATVIQCPACGNEMDIWTADDATRCEECDHEIYRKQRTLH
ncbi:MAG: hypothetical protein OEW15_04745 [Nitrospirota bacterium]|nr:hypothetical protein [Nitrospirota bacterium]